MSCSYVKAKGDALTASFSVMDRGKGAIVCTGEEGEKKKGPRNCCCCGRGASGGSKLWREWCKKSKSIASLIQEGRQRKGKERGGLGGSWAMR